MDLASALQILGRHKLIVATMLVLTLAAGAAVFLQSSQGREATGSYVLLSAPTPPRLADGTQEAANNPFSQMDLATVIDVLVRATSTDQVNEALLAQGFEGTYKVGGNNDYLRGPVLEMSVTASDSETALASYELLATEVGSVLQQRQLEAGANPQYLLSMQRLEDPVIIVPPVTGRIRPTVAVLALGVVLTVLVAFAAESIDRRRSARRAGQGEEDGVRESTQEASGDTDTDTDTDPGAEADGGREGSNVDGPVSQESPA